MQKEFFGDVIDTMYQNTPKLLIHIQHFLSANCFGDTYTRNGLNLAEREFLAFVILAVQGGCKPQLKSHIQANYVVGNSKKMLLEAVTQICHGLDIPAA